MSPDVLKPLIRVWNEAKQKMREKVEILPFWSEADLVHFITTNYEDALHKKVSKDLVAHVSSSLMPNSDLFGDLAPKLGEFLKEYNRKIGKKQAKVIPDIIVHTKEQVTHLQLCAEVKLFLGTNYWENKLAGVMKDLQELSLLKQRQICNKVALMVAFSPQEEMPEKQNELKATLNKWHREEPNLPTLRYNC